MLLAEHQLSVVRVRPDWERFGQFLRSRREELGVPNVDQLRRRTSRVPADKITRQTLANVENGDGCSMETFSYLPELYGVGYGELLAALWPEYDERVKRAEGLLIAMPWLEAVVSKLADASPEMQEGVRRLLQADAAVKIS